MDHQKIVVNYVGGACPQHFRYVFDIFRVFRLIVHWVHTPTPPPKKGAQASACHAWAAACARTGEGPGSAGQQGDAGEVRTVESIGRGCPQRPLKGLWGPPIPMYRCVEGCVEKC